MGAVRQNLQQQQTLPLPRLFETASLYYIGSQSTNPAQDPHPDVQPELFIHYALFCAWAGMTFAALNICDILLSQDHPAV